MKRLLCLLCMLSLITSMGLVNAANYVPPTPRPPLRPPVKAKETGEQTDYYKMKDVSINNKQYFYANKTLAEIESHSDIIVEGKPTGHSEQMLEYIVDQYVYAGNTYSNIRIQKVYKGDVRIDDIIRVAETYYIQDNTIYHDGLYYPSDKNKSYIWFLIDMRPYNYNHCALVRLERGRFPVLDANTRSANQLDSLSRQDLNLSPSGEAKDEEIYRDILKEVVAKYMNGSAE